MEPKCDATGKSIYTTEGEAKRVMNELKRGFHKWLGHTRKKRRHKKPRQKRVYFCSHCQGFHLTSWETWPHNTRLETKNIETKIKKKYKADILSRLIRPRKHRVSLETEEIIQA